MRIGISKRFIRLNIAIFFLFTSFVSAYPIIISEEGVNHSEAKELVYSIPESYYEDVEIIEFVNEPIYHWVRSEDNPNEYIWEFNAGWYNVWWDKQHRCYNGKIQIYYFPNTELNHYTYYELLRHELGHIHSHCVNKVDYSTEESANSFMIT
tara:strand:+ start:781 stop:1236 length:456 start_codon:yes stop_codon:yes gene_type:complete